MTTLRLILVVRIDFLVQSLQSNLNCHIRFVRDAYDVEFFIGRVVSFHVRSFERVLRVLGVVDGRRALLLESRKCRDEEESEDRDSDILYMNPRILRIPAVGTR